MRRRCVGALLCGLIAASCETVSPAPPVVPAPVESAVAPAPAVIPAAPHDPVLSPPRAVVVRPPAPPGLHWACHAGDGIRLVDHPGTIAPYVFFGTTSPDLVHVAYWAGGGRLRPPELRVIDLITGYVRAITRGPGQETIWRSDGQAIAFTVISQEFYGGVTATPKWVDVKTVDLAGTLTTRAHLESSRFRILAWNAESDTIVGASQDLGGIYGIHRLDARGNMKSSLPSSDLGRSWMIGASGDGRYLFRSYDFSVPGIASRDAWFAGLEILDAVTLAPISRRVTTGFAITGARLLPDGATLLVTITGPERSEVWLDLGRGLAQPVDERAVIDLKCAEFLVSEKVIAMLHDAKPTPVLTREEAIQRIASLHRNVLRIDRIEAKLVWGFRTDGIGPFDCCNAVWVIAVGGDIRAFDGDRIVPLPSAMWSIDGRDGSILWFRAEHRYAWPGGFEVLTDHSYSGPLEP